MKKILLLLSLFTIHSSLFTSVFAQTEVEPFRPGSTLEGVCYYLPKTAVRVVLTAEKTVVTPGQFARYAYKYMRMSGVPTTATTTWKIRKVEMQAYGTPDKDKTFTIKLRNRTIAPLVSLTREGLLLGINTEVQEENLPSLPEVEKPAQLPNPQKYLNQDMLTAGSMAKQAELIAEEIYDIRDSRGALLRGEADNTPKDGAQLQLMLSGIDDEDAALSSMFGGTTQTSTEVYTLDVIPTEVTDKLLLCRFSSKQGILGADDTTGTPVYMSVNPQNTLPDSVDNPKVKEKKEKMQQAVRFNVPVMTSLEVYDAHDSYASLDTPMAQFGTTEVLSNALFDKRTTTKVTFYQSTGAVRKVEE